jgi:hypothetical protein
MYDSHNDVKKISKENKNMHNVTMPLRPSCITAPVEKIHFCPICHNPFLDEPKESSIVEGLMVCPHCREQDKNLFFYWMNYKPIIEEYKPYHIHDNGALVTSSFAGCLALEIKLKSWDQIL